MASLEAFDNEVKELVTSGKLSQSRIKSVTDAAMANISSDAHLVATLFKVHKQAKSTHKISSLYVIDAIAREARQQVKKAAKGKQSSSNQSTPMLEGPGSGANDDSDEPVLGKKSAKGTYASFLSKIESFLDRLVAEVLTKGPPEHKEKVKKVLDIWKKSSTFSSDALMPCYSRLAGIASDTDQTTKSHSHRPVASSTRSTTPPYPPPDKPVQFPSYPPGIATSSISQPSSSTPPLFAPQKPSQTTSLAALLGSISAAQSTQPFAPPASQHNVPAFEISQLALLQQLAAQTNNAPPLPPSSQDNTAPVLLQPADRAHFPMPPQVTVTAPAPTTDLPQSRHQAQSSANGWGESSSSSSRRNASPPSNRRDRPSRWDTSDHYRQDERRSRRSISPVGDRYARGRDRSPPPRRRSPPPREDRRGGRDSQTSSWNEPASRSQQETRRIATFISEDRIDDRPGNKGKDPRRDVGMDDSPSFEVPTNRGAASSEQAGNASSTSWSQQESNDEAAVLMSNAPVFNPMSFNALDPQSWASFANMCQSNMGYMPSNMEMMQWIMTSMAMLQASAAQMNDGGDMMTGMQGSQGRNNTARGSNDQDNASQATHSNSRKWGGSNSRSQTAHIYQEERESSIGPDTRPPPPTRDSGTGEEDMNITPDP